MVKLFLDGDLDKPASKADLSNLPPAGHFEITRTSFLTLFLTFSPNKHKFKLIVLHQDGLSLEERKAMSQFIIKAAGLHIAYYLTNNDQWTPSKPHALRFISRAKATRKLSAPGRWSVNLTPLPVSEPQIIRA